ncbi:unnamed protein product [Blepharisma stoltei]|uniref:Thioredoxin domain-containing protein n=1 Tax=Blepharisma stoltei TaxID=1481888 RepID=A0AAU9JMJ2_9CILI|nr:unnamed protein product [Blepharisma stoltei]
MIYHYFLLLILSSLIANAQKAIDLSAANFDEFVINSQEVWMILFYSSEDNRSKNYPPVFKKSAVKLEGLAQYGMVNIAQEVSLSERFGISKLPAIKMFGAEKSNPIDFNQSPNFQSITDFANSRAPMEKEKIANWRSCTSQSGQESKSCEYKTLNPPPPPPPQTTSKSSSKPSEVVHYTQEWSQPQQAQILQLTSQRILDSSCREWICIILFVPKLNSSLKEIEKYLGILNDLKDIPKDKNVNFLWAQGGDFSEFENVFGTSEIYPSIVGMRMKKQKFTLFNGRFERNRVSRFYGKLIRGGIEIKDYSSLPVLNEVKKWTQ